MVQLVTVNVAWRETDEKLPSQPTSYTTRLRLYFSPEIPEIIDATGVMNLIYRAPLYRAIQERDSLPRPTDRPRTKTANFILHFVQ